MNRADMLQVIGDFLYNTRQEEWECPLDQYQSAEALLKKIEDLGMLPPHSRKKDLGCECGCKGRCVVGNNWDDI